jgi:hypothetical protein
MAIKSISRRDFDAFRPARGPAVGEAWEEVEWFAADNDVVIGVLTRDFKDDDWGYAVLGPDQYGRYRAIGNDACIVRREAARTLLITAMEHVLETGETVFPHPDAWDE